MGSKVIPEKYIKNAVWYVNIYYQLYVICSCVSIDK